MKMYSNTQLMTYSTAFENSSTPFRFYQTNIVIEPERSIFPYTNWFRGQYTSCTPIIADREAGFYPRTEPTTTAGAYTGVEQDPKHCFRGATSQTRKCHTNKGFNKWVQVDPSYLGNEPIVSYI